MVIKLYRILKEEGGVIGRLFMPGLGCWTQERDCDNLIPDGTYPVRLVDSAHFGPDTLWICREPEIIDYNQPHLYHNLLHGGNTIVDVIGCVEVGDDLDTIGTDTVNDSQKTLTAIKAILIPLLKAGEKVTVQITTLQ